MAVPVYGFPRTDEAMVLANPIPTGWFTLSEGRSILGSESETPWGLPSLLPLNRRRRLARDVVDHAPNLRDLSCDPLCGLIEDLER